MSNPSQIHIVGMGVCNSVATHVDSFTTALREGRSGIRKLVPDHRDDERKSSWVGADIRDLNFDSHLSKYKDQAPTLCALAAKTSRRSTDTVRLSIVTALEAWLDAELDNVTVDPSRVALIVAGQYSTGQYFVDGLDKYRTAPEYLSPRFALEFQETFALGLISNVLGIRGEGFNVGGASASGNIALIRAEQLLKLGLADVCVVCGMSPNLSNIELQAFRNLGALGGKRFAEMPSQACRPFDKEREGFIHGQGSACIILESENSRSSRGVCSQAQLLGSSSRLSGGNGAEPDLATEVLVMQEALDRGEVSSDSVSYVNAHGTSSVIGDETELRALESLFGGKHVLVNSTKSLIGHCLACAGMQEAIASVIQLRHGFRHVSANIENPVQTDLVLLDESVEDKSQFALSNSFGFSGIHSSILLSTALS